MQLLQAAALTAALEAVLELPLASVSDASKPGLSKKCLCRGRCPFGTRIAPLGQRAAGWTPTGLPSTMRITLLVGLLGCSGDKNDLGVPELPTQFDDPTPSSERH